jgi:hypothetical protein
MDEETIGILLLKPFEGGVDHFSPSGKPVTFFVGL